MPRGQGIKPLNSLFEKYKLILRAPQGSVIKEFCEIIEEVVGVSIKPEQVRYTVHNKTLALTVPGPIKTEIKLKQKEIVAHLKGRLGAQNAPVTIL